MGFFTRLTGADVTAAYDALNPICAPVFHRVFDEMQGKGASRKAFENPDTRKALDAVRASGKISADDGREAEFNFCLFTIRRLEFERDTVLRSEMADFFRRNEDTLGVDGGMRHVRDLVFAAGPALASSPAEVHAATTRMAFCLKGMLAKQESAFMRAAGRAFMIFGLEFDAVTMRHDTKFDADTKMDAWVAGYEAAA